jgi:uncharacterized protein (TIGR00730 family)
LRRICVFCGSSPGARPEYRSAAIDLANALVDRSLGLVYGGASVGLMGVIADQVLARGGEVIGVFPASLTEVEVVHNGLPDLRRVGSMHERKAQMAELADGFIALPGGFGTLDEFSEMITWEQLGLHQKPSGLLNICGYYDDLLRFLDHAVAEGFIKPKHRSSVLIASDPAQLLDQFARYDSSTEGKWIDRGDES